MSAQPVERHAPEVGAGADLDLTTAPEPVEIRRNAAVSVAIGAAASGIAIAYLWRAAGSGAWLDWALCLLMGVMGATFLRSLLDSRTPLLVADEMGVRIRFGTLWRGLPWEAIDRVVVKPRRGLLHDGRLVVSLHHLQRAIEGLDGRALRAARLNQRMYGAAIAVPLGLTTRVTGDGETDLADRVAALSQGRTEVVTVVAPEAPEAPQVDESGPDEVAVEARAEEAAPAPAPDRRPRWRRRPPAEPDVEPVEPQVALAEVEPVVVPLQVEPVEEVRVRPAPYRAFDAVSTAGAGDGRVRSIAKLGEPVAPLVIGEFEPEPAYDPVIGPELAAARTRVGLSVDELADRTRIRPHVIESIEVDDFTPCGGDFYARGHIRTLARVLGKDPAPMLEHFDARYATAPINARRVFEAELATGMTGSMRSTVGGPNWALLVGVVLTLVLVWSAVRLFAGDSQEMLENPPPVLNGSAGLGNVYGEPQAPAGPQPVPVSLAAVNAGTHVEVRDAEGELVFEGDLVIGEVKRLEVEAPVTVSSDNGAALSVTLGQRDMGFLGESDQPATRVFQRSGA